MSDQTIFGNTETPADQTNQQSSDGGVSNTSNAQNESSFTDLLGSIRNERGEPKYKSTDDAIKALKHSQDFIPQLKDENLQLRSKVEELQSAVERLKRVEDVVERLAASRDEGGNTNQPKLDEQTIAELMERTLTQREVESRKKTNVSTVAKTLQDKFGAEAEKIFYSKAAELGMDANAINSLAASSPQAVLQLFNVQPRQGQTVNMPSPVREGLNSAGFQPSQDSFVRRNDVKLSVGATTQEYQEEARKSKKMVEELHEKGISVSDLSDPKKYFAQFK